jgi:hypothetical protein
MGIKKIELPMTDLPHSKTRLFVYTAKVFFFGAIISAGVTLASCGYWYFSQPKQSLSKVQAWVVEHPEEADWAMKRWEKFQIASKELYMKEDAVMLEPSK